MAVIKGIKIIWGEERPGNFQTPALPVGWSVIRRPDSYAVAVSPESKKFMIGDGVLYPLIETLKADMANPVQISSL